MVYAYGCYWYTHWVPFWNCYKLVNFAIYFCFENYIMLGFCVVHIGHLLVYALLYQRRWSFRFQICPWKFLTSWTKKKLKISESIHCHLLLRWSHLRPLTYGPMSPMSQREFFDSCINLFPAGEFGDFHICLREKLWGCAVHRWNSENLLWLTLLVPELSRVIWGYGVLPGRKEVQILVSRGELAARYSCFPLDSPNTIWSP